MKSLCAVYCLALWTYFAVFAFMPEAPELAGSQKERNQFGSIRSLNPIAFRNSPPLLENNRQLEENVPPIEDIHTLETLQFNENDSAATERIYIPTETSQDPLARLDVSLDLSLASKNSCIQIDDSLYMTEEKKITFLSKEFSAEHCPFNWVNIFNIQNSSFKGAVWDPGDLGEIISSMNESNHTPDDPSILPSSRTLHFLMNTSEVASEQHQQYVIFRCIFIIDNTSAITKATRDKHFRKNEETQNVSITIRLLGSSDSKEFNIRSIVEDMDKFVVPRYCSSKIPFFYFLVISGELRENSFLLIFVTFNYILSTCSLALIFITATLSHEWRQRGSNIILINFAISMFSQIMLHFISDYSETDEGLCAIVTVLCHYFTLVQFLWTSTIAYMQYRRYVQVFEEKNSNFLIKLILFTWITPILVISASLIYVFSMSENSKKTCGDKLKICSLINTYLLKYSVSLPLFITLFVNFIFFILIFRHLLRRKCEFDQRTSALVEVKLAFVLFFLLDLNLIVAIIADMFSVDILALIFVTSHSLQGFLLFIVFVIRNKCSRKMYVRWMKIMLDRIAFYTC